MIIAKMLWRFDVSLMQESRGWAENMKAYTLWEKPPMMMGLAEVKR